MADRETERLGRMIAPLRVQPGSRVHLARDFDPASTSKLVGRKDADELLRHGVEVLDAYQERLAAQATHGLLVCLQALDAAGKDGAIRHVMSGVNPKGVGVTSFREPSAVELQHDFLWRYQQHLPARGEIEIFDRSHYEEVVVVRVHPELLEAERLPRHPHGEELWMQRYDQINRWEQHLVASGFPVVKIFLNVSREEQRRRILDRLDQPDKNWKFSSHDVRERAFWDDYHAAFSAMLSNTSTEWAPWYVVPADHKWFARLCVSAILMRALRELDPQFPPVSPAARADLEKARVALEAEAG